jgi:hypothetical protein
MEIPGGYEVDRLEDVTEQKALANSPGAADGAYV